MYLVNLKKKMDQFFPCYLPVQYVLINKDVVNIIFKCLSHSIQALDFHIMNFDYLDNIWWTGLYSIGSGNENDWYPRIYLRPPFSTTFLTRFEEEGDLSSADLCAKRQFYQDLENGDEPRDYGYIEYITIPSLVKMLKEKKGAAHLIYDKYEWERQRHDDDITSSLIINDKDLIIVPIYLGDDTWVIHDVEGLIRELEEVLKKCVQRNDIIWIRDND